MSIIVRNADRVDRDVAASFAEFGVATVHEAQGRTGLMHSRLRPIYRPIGVAGTALTCQVPPGDNWAVHIAVEQARPGDVLVVSPTSPCTDGYFGELLATSFAAHGVVGLVIDAGVRDVAELTKMGFPVWSRAVHARGTVKRTPGNVQTPIVCAGIYVEPGDVIVGDDDGVVVVPRGTAVDVLAAARTRMAEESEKRAQLRAGHLGLDIYDMRDDMRAAGFVYTDADDTSNET